VNRFVYCLLHKFKNVMFVFQHQKYSRIIVIISDEYRKYECDGKQDIVLMRI